MADFNTWYNQSIGEKIDVDGSYGDQCVDVAMSWAQFCFPGHGWSETLGHGDAKDLYETASTNYFDKPQAIPPQQGDMVVFGPTSTNPYGHIAVVVSADTAHMNVIEQNGFNPSGVAYTAQRPYNNITGFLRPKGQDEMITKEILDSVYGAYFGSTPTQADYDNWVGKNELPNLITQSEQDQRRKAYFETVQKGFACLNAPIAPPQADGFTSADRTTLNAIQKGIASILDLLAKIFKIN